MEKFYQVLFICDNMVVQTTIGADISCDDEQITEIASAHILDNYGFNPLDLSFDTEISEV